MMSTQLKRILDLTYNRPVPGSSAADVLFLHPNSDYALVYLRLHAILYIMDVKAVTTPLEKEFA